MSETRFTSGPWTFGRMSSAIESASLSGTALEPHEGYPRENNGNWIVTSESSGRIAAVAFKGEAKKSEAYRAPDPIGQANAALIAAAPELYAEVAAFVAPYAEVTDRQLQHAAAGSPGTVKVNIDPSTAGAVLRFRIVLAKARGDHSHD